MSWSQWLLAIVAAILSLGVGGFCLSAVALSFWDDHKLKRKRRTDVRTRRS